MSNVQSTTGADKLIAYLDRMEKLLDEIDGLKDDLKDMKAQARDDGFNVAAMLRLVAIRRSKQRADRESEFLNDLVLYAHATGTPLDFSFVEEDWSPPASPKRTPPTDSASPEETPDPEPDRD
ncbi:conserved hypothetical protein [Candidatus Defluviicoccus seviourii]|uniref:GapR-like DNA-binding domain-containing protein n=1 Tax=Candidatus Defluviicoccus seviourii TaxID=2565273 RepID=A0A564WE04_9PROT|nr:conserved hypothetical protein [Candidatus Defluviicoccus seviourii]